MLGTPYSKTARKFMLLGSGELGKEVVIEAQRFGVETIAIDNYPNAPAMQVAHHARVIDMQDAEALQSLVDEFQPDWIVPEVEAINTEFLLKLEEQGQEVIPTARATNLTMNREGIRRLASEELGLKTAKYAFAETLEEFKKGVAEIGIPCVIKPIQSSSGKGQSTIKSEADIENSWNYALEGSRGKSNKVIIEEFVHFDSEITLLTIRTKDGTLFCEPVGHRQEGGDYQESWQPQRYSPEVLAKCQHIGKMVTDNLGGRGIFGCELFIKGEEVYFSEISPRPHDTGMVTMITQDMSQFELHVRAILGLPIPQIKLFGAGASHVLLSHDLEAKNVAFEGVEEALKTPHSKLRLFGKPESRKPHRRMGVALALGKDTDEARQLADEMAQKVTIKEA